MRVVVVQVRLEASGGSQLQGGTGEAQPVKSRQFDIPGPDATG